MCTFFSMFWDQWVLWAIEWTAVATGTRLLRNPYLKQ